MKDEKYWCISLNGKRVAEVVNGEHGATSENEAIAYHISTSLAFSEVEGGTPANFQQIIDHMIEIGAINYTVKLRYLTPAAPIHV